MPYVELDGFPGGIDRTRLRAAGKPGTAWDIIDGHLTRGGDIENRKEFVAQFQLASNTFGMQPVGSGNLYVFGSAATPGTIVTTVGTISGVSVGYMRLQHTNAAGVTTGDTMTAIKQSTLFNGQIYAVAQYSNGEIRHFLNGAPIMDWHDLGLNNPTTVADIVRTHQRKLYGAAGSTLFFSETDVGNNFTSTATGAGFINMSTHQAGFATLTGLGTYQDKLAVFARNVIQIWSMYDDDALNVPFQVLENTGTRSPRSILQFGDSDLIYLSDSGIRSLRARSGVNTAGVNDVGTPIDALIQSALANMTADDIASVHGVVEPVDGRVWMVMPGSGAGQHFIYVFSYFPTTKVSGWSRYNCGDNLGNTFKPSWTGVLSNSIWQRGFVTGTGDYLYQYGGTNGTTYGSNRPCTVYGQFVDMRKAGSFKQLIGADMIAEGPWWLYLHTDPNDADNKYVEAGQMDDVSLNKPNVGAVGNYPLVAPRIISQSGATHKQLSKLFLHYLKGKNDP